MQQSATNWLYQIRFYVAVLLPWNLVWECLQLPLYSIWSNASPREIIFAVLHCTAGDGLIGASCLGLALLVGATSKWPAERFGVIAWLTIASGLAFTIYSEWHNTVVVHAWHYATSMPVIGPIGLAPLAQWLLIPSAIFWRMRSRVTFNAR